ncbi:MAG: type II toxin-antitoxin system prevent-host-death family antitoxin [Deltaproteobacteria bacterium]|nr:MAG: type II toxin-antitoxin system prevent-host-death family antitoxin [Deltaproteobacteria bacterium]
MSKASVTTSELKANCSRIIDGVARRRESLVITRHGKPIAKLVPVDVEQESLFGFAAGSITVRGDILEPLDADWEAAGS